MLNLAALNRSVTRPHMLKLVSTGEGRHGDISEFVIFYIFYAFLFLKTRTQLAMRNVAWLTTYLKMFGGKFFDRGHFSLRLSVPFYPKAFSVPIWTRP